MPEREDRLEFLDNATRLKVALACRDEPRTHEQIARVLGRPSGGLSAPKTMLKHGALVVARKSQRAGVRAEEVWLSFNPEWEPELEELLARDSAAFLEAGRQLVLVPVGATARACAVLRRLADPQLTGVVLHGEQMGLLLCPPQSRTGSESLQLLGALGDAGVQALRLHLGQVLAPAELTRWAAEVAEGSSDGPALPAG